MRGLGSALFIVLVGCTSRQKAPAAVDGSANRRAPPTLDASQPEPPAHDPSPDASLPPQAPPTPPPDPPPGVTERRPTAAALKECAARGGSMQPVCMLGELACVVRYRDGGKRCTDRRDCTGECLYEGAAPAPPKAFGSCQRTSDPCGCRAPIHDGHVEPTFCVD